jgi:hypothetical protein
MHPDPAVEAMLMGVAMFRPDVETIHPVRSVES